ncbi:mycofactocin system transcriptional regulator [Nocardioides marmoriginsengisoli]|uniref:Mycofactocin system transcriptional regulator n=1 Tax=Nocardioides marmoriginsengisoli TaxID=661483 RepID=A0A3N0CDD7_9ACTN|nr:mycofactocin system transcriptional regulator [Nocardioides marmoriginsengisoli]RNL61309.1 mycofactocin system transcriptional regulator [Nocardioides marmoriginsengisoli]
MSNSFAPGRPPATDHAAIERVAFALFAEQGFERTTVDDIAEAVGIGRRTLFRYYPSKNDIPWGQFDASLIHLRETLAQMPADVPTYRAVHAAVQEFNQVDDAAVEQHRQRMRLLLTTPALQAHSVLRYTAWRRIIAEFVAERYDLAADDFFPRTIGHVTLASSLSAYEGWLESESAPFSRFLDEALDAIRGYYADPA